MRCDVQKIEKIGRAGLGYLTPGGGNGLEEKWAMLGPKNAHCNKDICRLNSECDGWILGIELLVVTKKMAVSDCPKRPLGIVPGNLKIAVAEVCQGRDLKHARGAVVVLYIKARYGDFFSATRTGERG